MFVIDVSRSMLAGDATPSRLDRAKLFVEDAVDSMAGDQLDVDFAGDAVIRSPLTLNYDALKTSLANSPPRFESRQLDARRRDPKAADSSQRRRQRRSSSSPASRTWATFPSRPPRPWREHGARVYTVGLGGDGEGAQFPSSTGASGPGSASRARRSGPAWIRRCWPGSRKPVAVFVPAGTSLVDLEDTPTTGSAPSTSATGRASSSSIPRFQWFAIALVLLVVEATISNRRGGPGTGGRITHGADDMTPAPRHAQSTNGLVAILVVGGSMLADAAPPPTPTPSDASTTAAEVAAVTRAAERLMAEDDWSAAARAWEEVRRLRPRSGEAATTSASPSIAGRLDEAATAFPESAELGDADLAARAMYNENAARRRAPATGGGRRCVLARRDERRCKLDADPLRKPSIGSSVARHFADAIATDSGIATPSRPPQHRLLDNGHSGTTVANRFAGSGSGEQRPSESDSSETDPSDEPQDSQDGQSSEQQPPSGSPEPSEPRVRGGAAARGIGVPRDHGGGRRFERAGGLGGGVLGGTGRGAGRVLGVSEEESEAREADEGETLTREEGERLLQSVRDKERPATTRAGSIRAGGGPQATRPEGLVMVPRFDGSVVSMCSVVLFSSDREGVGPGGRRVQDQEPGGVGGPVVPRPGRGGQRGVARPTSRSTPSTA